MKNIFIIMLKIHTLVHIYLCKNTDIYYRKIELNEYIFFLLQQTLYQSQIPNCIIHSFMYHIMLYASIPSMLYPAHIYDIIINFFFLLLGFC